MKLYTSIFLLIFILVLGPFSPPADAGGFERVKLPIAYRTWTLKTDDGTAEKSISQFVIPAITTIALAPATDLVVSLGGGASSLELENGSNLNLNGPTDGTAQVFHHFADNHALVHAGLSIPSGKTELDTLDERSVAVLLGNPVLGFPLREYGRGLDLSMGAAYAKSLGRGVVLGFGGGLIKHGAYTIYEGDKEYLPGLETSISIGLDGVLAKPRGTLLRLDATYRFFSTDEYDEASVFTQGDQMVLQSRTKTHSDRYRIDTFGRVIIQAKNVRHENGPGDNTKEIEASSGTQIFLSAIGQKRISDDIWIGLLGEWNQFSGSDMDGLNGSAFGVGPTLTKQMGSTLSVQLRTGLLSGSIDGDDSYPGIDLNGFNASLHLSLTPQ